ncbi:MAG: FAD-dependent oxidoreductase [Gemmatimonadales bacterium]
MIVDAGSLSRDRTLETDVCIVGAGPAGLVLAHRLARSGREVLVLESGALAGEHAAQRLNEGRVIGGPYAGLRETRWRQVGGSANRWNTMVDGHAFAKFTPLDEWDLQAWPFGPADLAPWYREAQHVLRLGPHAYEGSDWPDPNRPELPLASDVFVTRIYQFGTAGTVLAMAEAVRTSDRIRVCPGLTATGVTLDGSGSRVTGLAAARLDGLTVRVAASRVILAAGAIENARLLLLLRQGTLAGQAWLGRGFMEHPRDYSLALLPASPTLLDRMGFYDAHRAADGTIIGGRLGLTRDAVVADRLPNAAVTLLPRRRPLGPLATLVDRTLLRTPRGYGWSRVRAPGRRYDGLRLVINLEQRPRLENCIRLGPDRDPLGLPRPVLEWSWSAEEQAGLERLRAGLARGLGDAGIGRLVIEPGARPDPNAHHHAGTTRMHVDPREGVVDADCRVHGLENLYVAGGSVFPSAGFANPVLTIVALCLRLAAHLDGLNAPSRSPPRTS